MAIKNILFISDIHAGDKLAICPPNVYDVCGGSYKPSDFQLALWDLLCQDYERAAKLFNGEKFTLLIGAELIQGTWSRFGTLSGNLATQFRIAREIMMKLKEYVDDKQIEQTIALAGNEAHTGMDDVYQELMYEFLKTDFKIKRKKNRLTQYRHQIKLANGAILDACHYFSVTNVYPLTAYQREFYEMAKDAARRGKRAPDICYRAHIHRFGVFPLEMHPLTKVGCFSTPGWQAMNIHAMKGLARLKKSHFGLVVGQVKDKFEITPMLHEVEE